MRTLVERLRALAYWLCAGLSGERDDPYKAADRIVALEAEVAHFQAEYQDEVGRTELIANVETLKAEVATFKRKLDDAAQLIKMRTADCATLKADNANHLKLNATLIYERDMARSDNADLRAEANTTHELMFRVVAERDRLKTALERIERWFGEFPSAELRGGYPCSYGVAFGSNGERDFMRSIARSALAPNPLTEEGG